MQEEYVVPQIRYYARTKKGALDRCRRHRHWGGTLAGEAVDAVAQRQQRSSLLLSKHCFFLLQLQYGTLQICLCLFQQLDGERLDMVLNAEL